MFGATFNLITCVIFETLKVGRLQINNLASVSVTETSSKMALFQLQKRLPKWHQHFVKSG